MEMDVLVAGSLDITGIWSLISIVWIIVVIILYKVFGILGGSLCCCVTFLLCLICSGDPIQTDGSSIGGTSNEFVTEPDGVNRYANGGIITNRNRTKFIGKNNYRKDDGIFSMGHGPDGKPEQYFIPEKEMYVDDGSWMMKSTGEHPWEDDDEHYYIYSETVNQFNVPTKYGGEGLSTKTYHPAAAIWIFGIGALPVIIGGSVLRRVWG